MISFNSTATPTRLVIPHSSTKASSQCSPWLTPFVYLLGDKIVVPGYFGEIKITGQQHIPLEGPIILAPTHRSRWDGIILSLAAGRTVTGRDLRFMVTSTEVQGFQGWLIRRLGGFAVDIAKPAISSLRYGIEILHRKEMLVIFPEGDIFRESVVHPLKPGLARLALQAEVMQPGLGVKIVPIGLSYAQPYPSKGCDITLNIGHPLTVAQYQGGSSKQGANRLTADLRAALIDLSEPNGSTMLAPSVC